MVKQKVIHLDDEIIKVLSKLAIDSPERNFKKYVEKHLTDLAMIKKLKDLQK